MSEPIVDTVHALRQCHRAMAESQAPEVRDAGQTIMAALILNLKHPQQVLPEETATAWAAIKEI